jgi:hypothetical protein
MSNTNSSSKRMRPRNFGALIPILLVAPLSVAANGCGSAIVGDDCPKGTCAGAANAGRGGAGNAHAGTANAGGASAGSTNAGDANAGGASTGGASVGAAGEADAGAGGAVTVGTGGAATGAGGAGTAGGAAGTAATGGAAGAGGGICSSTANATGCVACCAAQYPGAWQNAFFGNECLYCSASCSGSAFCTGEPPQAIDATCTQCVQSNWEPGDHCNFGSGPACAAMVECVKRCPTN